MPDMEYLKRATEINPEVIANRRYLHQHPELAFDLDNTVRFVKEKLTEMGYAPADCGDHGVVALAGGRKPGKCILIRADMDALPMKEESGLEFSSLTDSAAHTCGHDTHTAMLLGAAKLLKEMEDEIPGTVKLMFQPAEEMGTGAENMLKAGVLENPHVDASFGIHIFAAVPAGVLVYGNGPMLSSCDVFEITVKGKGGHGSMPNDTVDPIMVGAHILTALESINSREIAPDSFGVLTVGCFQSGSKFNIIPDTAFMTGTIRTFDAGVHQEAPRRARGGHSQSVPRGSCGQLPDPDLRGQHRQGRRPHRRGERRRGRRRPAGHRQLQADRGFRGLRLHHQRGPVHVLRTGRMPDGLSRLSAAQPEHPLQ